MMNTFFVAQDNAQFSPTSEYNSQPDDPHGILESLRRKRERDRHSQRRKRQRERDYINELEREVRLLKQKLEASKCTCGGIQDAQFPIEQSSLSDTETATRAMSSDASPSGKVTTTEKSGQRSSYQYPTRTRKNYYNLPQNLPVSSDAMEKVMANPPWLRIPPTTTKVHDYDGNVILGADQVTPLIEELRADSKMIERCPIVPRVIDIMFGGSNNPLANFVVSEFRPVPMLAPEKFAFTWLTYLYLLWLTWPTQEHFEALPEHLRPTPTQLMWEHPLWYDFFMWPEIRDNLIRCGEKYDLIEVFGLIGCTGRILGGFNRPFITRENDGDPQVRDDFYQSFLKRSSWGILQKFWVDYPELVEGMDQSEMITEEDLILLRGDVSPFIQ